MRAFLLLLFLPITVISFSQDTIFLKNGDTISCYLQRSDSSSIYFTKYQEGRKINTSIKKIEIQEIRKYADYRESFKPEMISVSAGIGLEYGGLGLNYIVFPQKNIGVLFAGGINTVGLTYNVGVRLRLIKNENKEKFIPYLTAMYGCNSIIFLRFGSSLNRISYGYSVGIGVESHPKNVKKGYWTFGILYSLRDAEVANYISELNDKQSMGFRFGCFPVTLSIGYRWKV